MEQDSRLRRAWYQFWRRLCHILAIPMFRCRTYRRERIPATGPVVLLANHESHLDPVLIGIASQRKLSFLARESLFRGPFGHLIRSLDAIPIDRKGVSLTALRGVIRRLKQGEATLVFPEGTRSPDGRLGLMQPGFSVLVRRSKASIVPIGIDGAFRAWPRNRRIPRPARITMHIGRPLAPATIAALNDKQLLETVQRKIVSSVRVARWCAGRRDWKDYHPPSAP